MRIRVKVVPTSKPRAVNQCAHVVVPPLVLLALVAQVALDLGHGEVRAAEDGLVGGGEQPQDRE